MFLRSHSRSKDGKAHIYWSLVETVRTPDGPRQRTICYLGELNSSRDPAADPEIIFRGAGGQPDPAS
jgi:hypothetical protein